MKQYAFIIFFLLSNLTISAQIQVKPFTEIKIVRLIRGENGVKRFEAIINSHGEAVAKDLRKYQTKDSKAFTASINKLINEERKVQSLSIDHDLLLAQNKKPSKQDIYVFVTFFEDEINKSTYVYWDKNLSVNTYDFYLFKYFSPDDDKFIQTIVR